MSATRAWGLYGPAQLEDAPPTDEFLEDWLARTCESSDNYRPQLVWFDWWIEQPPFGHIYEFRRLSTTTRRRMGARRRHQLQETVRFPMAPRYSTSSAASWATSPTFSGRQTLGSEELLGYIASRNTRDRSRSSRIWSTSSARMARCCSTRAEARWHIAPGNSESSSRSVAGCKVNGEAIYGTRPWHAYGEGPTSVSEGSFQDTKRDAFTSEDIRYTVRGNDLYALLLAKPDNGLRRLHTLAAGVNGPGAAVRRVSLSGLGSSFSGSRGPPRP